jgi:hypothetical protein
MQLAGIKKEFFVEKTLTAEVVIETQNLWWATVLAKPQQLIRASACVLNKVVPERVPLVYSPTEQIKSKPSSLILQLRLIT